MPQYRRSKILGGTYFFTVVTYNRLPILTTEEARNIRRHSWLDVRCRFPFSLGKIGGSRGDGVGLRGVGEWCVEATHPTDFHYHNLKKLSWN
jgi:hypothetical protein